MYLSPAQYVIELFGGIRATSRAVGASPETVRKWREPKERRGCGGLIPSGWQVHILAYAGLHGLDITPADMIYGRELPEIEATPQSHGAVA